MQDSSLTTWPRWLLHQLQMVFSKFQTIKIQSPFFWQICLIFCVCIYVTTNIKTLICHAMANIMTSNSLVHIWTNNSQSSFSTGTGTSPSETSALNKPYIRERNLFNHNGIIPFEDTPEAEKILLDSHFKTLPCSTQSGEKFDLSLVGIIFSTNPKNRFVILNTQKGNFTNVYKEKEDLLDNPQISVIAILDPANVHLRYKQEKICLSLPDTIINNHFPPTQEEATGQINIIQLQRTDVDKALGNGDSTALVSSQVIPVVQNGTMLGFRVITSTPGSLFAIMDLKTGDIVTSVNGKDLKSAANGFQIYDELAKNGDVEFELIRNGVEMTKKVHIQ